MNVDQNSSGQAQDLETEESRDLTEMKKNIQLSNVQLLQLTYNDEKFISHINELNAKGIQHVSNQEHKQAVIYFNQNQKILQYAASCGKTMDRSIIVVTLHNQACVNQKLWDLQKSANYLQAIIYNINFYFQNIKRQQKIKDEPDVVCAYIHKKQLFALYHLQFCAVNSQIRKHTISLNAAKTAIKIMREVCKQSHQMSQKIIYNDLSEITQAKNNSTVFKQLSNLQEELVISDYQKYFSVVKTIMQQKSRNRSSNEDQHKSVRNFSIGKLMQLLPITLQDLQPKFTAREWVKYDNIINLALYLGVCYFTVGTELRFISSQNCQQGNQVYKLSEDFLISEVYHIFAIMIVMKYVPVRSIFLNHLLTSFNSHYQIDLEKVLCSNVNIPEPEIRGGHKKQRSLADPQSPTSSIELPAINILPQQSSIKNGRNANNFQEQQVIQDQNRDINKLSDSKTKTKHSQKSQKQLKNSNYQAMGNSKTSRSKSPKFELKSINKQKKREKNSNSNFNSNLNDKLKSDTFTGLDRKLQKQRHQMGNRDKSLKQKTEYRKSISIKKKKTEDKICIYTTRLKKDKQIEQKARHDQQKISHQKLKIKVSRQKFLKLNSPSEGKVLKSKSKERTNLRNLLGKQQKKNMQSGTIISKQQKSKSKSRNKQKKQKMIKMHKVEGSKFKKTIQ